VLPALPGVRHRHVDARGLRFHVAEAGEGTGPPVLLVHGWPQHWWMWREVIPRLAADHRVVAPDLRGLGWTDAPDGPYDKQTLADDLLAVLDSLGLAKVVYVGHDWGAFAGQLLALAAPGRVERLVVCSVPDLWARRQLDPRPALGMLHMPPLSASHLLVPAVARTVMQLGGMPGSPEPYLERLRDPARARASVGYYRTFLTRELPALAAGRFAGRRLEVPARFVVGDRDPVVRWIDFGDRFPVTRLRGVGHFLPEEAPEAVVEAVRAF